MRSLLHDFQKIWNRFWFQLPEEQLSSLGIFRISFGLALVFFFLSRQADVALFYTNSGLMPASFLATLPEFELRWTLLTLTDNLLLLQILHGLLVVSCLLFALGIFPRFFALLAYLLALNFMNRNPIAVFGADTISSFFLFYLIFTRCGERYALLPSKAPGEWGRLIGAIAYRLMQVQLCVIYSYSGWEKLRGTRWWDGSAIWDVLQINSMQRWDMSFLVHVPILLSLVAYTVLFWEIYFFVLICFKRIRPYVLWYGVLMHVGIIIFLNLPSFGILMMTIYVLFLSGKTVDRFVKKLLNVGKSQLPEPL